ncbi:MAG: carbon storage regulator [Planctomycetes bacterium]|nr:carbon storage regulator [Planctomycetota bacterium]
MLVLSRKTSEQIKIGENITVTVVHVKGKVVRLGIDAPRNMRILRTELISDDEESSASGEAVVHAASHAEPTEDETTGEDDARGIHACHGRPRRAFHSTRTRRGITMMRPARGSVGNVAID